MSARMIFAALVAAFARPQLNDAHAPATHERVAETDGLVSELSAARIRAAFSRFAKFIGGAG